MEDKVRERGYENQRVSHKAASGSTEDPVLIPERFPLIEPKEKARRAITVRALKQELPRKWGKCRGDISLCRAVDNNPIQMNGTEIMRGREVYPVLQGWNEEQNPVIEPAGGEREFSVRYEHEVKEKIQELFPRDGLRFWRGLWQTCEEDTFGQCNRISDWEDQKETTTSRIGTESMEVMARSMDRSNRLLCAEFGWEDIILREGRGNGRELPGDFNLKGKTIYGTEEKGRQIISMARFPEEELWSAVSDGIGQEIRERIDQEVVVHCLIMVHKENGTYALHLLDRCEDYKDGELIINPTMHLLGPERRDRSKGASLIRRWTCVQKRSYHAWKANHRAVEEARYHWITSGRECEYKEVRNFWEQLDRNRHGRKETRRVSGPRQRSSNDSWNDIRCRRR
jgi:hypothetical protein